MTTLWIFRLQSHRQEIGWVAINLLVRLLVGEQNVLVPPDRQRRKAQQNEAKRNEEEHSKPILHSIPANEAQNAWSVFHKKYFVLLSNKKSPNKKFRGYAPLSFCFLLCKCAQKNVTNDHSQVSLEVEEDEAHTYGEEQAARVLKQQEHGVPCSGQDQPAAECANLEQH